MEYQRYKFKCPCYMSKQANDGRRAFWFECKRLAEFGESIGNESSRCSNEKGLKVFQCHHAVLSKTSNYCAYIR